MTLERHHDYVLGPNQDARLASIDPGQSITGITLALDVDAPFLLRSRAVRQQYDLSRQQTNNVASGAGLNHFLMRWAGPDRDYRQQTFVRQNLYAPYFGQIGNPIPVYPQVFYPRQAQITVDVFNDGTDALINVTMYFRGVKLFSPGAVRSYEYPAKFGLLPYVYPKVIAGLPVFTGPIRNTLLVKGDADFVLRGGQAGDTFTSPRSSEVFITIRDEDEKRYSNDAVHADVLFGNSNMGNIFAGGSPIAGGPNAPGLFYPEIYIPKNHLIYFDVSRDDSYLGEAAAVDYPISFIGQKVFAK